MVHILNVEAMSRAIRAHFSVEAALNALIDTYCCPQRSSLSTQPDTSNNNNNAEVATVPPGDLSDEVIDTTDLDEDHVVNEKLVDGTVSVEYYYAALMSRTEPKSAFTSMLSPLRCPLELHHSALNTWA